jgi:hypothetical protein
MSTEGSTYEFDPEFDPPAELVIYSEPGDCTATDSSVDQQTTDSKRADRPNHPT